MNSKSPDFPYKLLELAKQYVRECEEHTKQTTAAYKIVELKDRKLPTIDYFIHSDRFTDIQGEVLQNNTWHISDHLPMIATFSLPE